jgi:hypothetical protein
MSEPQPHPSSEPDDEDEDAPRAEQAGVDDEAFAVNLRRRRQLQEVSQGELARRMMERGFPFYQQTIRRIEDHTRKVSVGEGKALAQILDTTLDLLTSPPEEADAVNSVVAAASAVTFHGQGVSRSVAALLAARDHAEKVLRETEGTPWPKVDTLREVLGERMDIYTLELAVEHGEKVHHAATEAKERTADERS